MATLPPQLFPSDGVRKFTAKETMQRAKALNCTVAKKSGPSCVGQLNIGIFFDGTGNNKKLDYESLDPERRKHSNVVKIFNGYPDRNADGYFSYYIPGVGTPFPEIGDTGKNPLGGGAAWNGENRIIWAFTRLLNAIHRYVLGSDLLDDEMAYRVSNNMSSVKHFGFMRELGLKDWQKTLTLNLKGKKPRIELINLSVFGFSRGAAQSRAFCNWLFDVCKPLEGGGWEFAGIPIRVSFLGIFDTVASVGIPDALNNSVMEGHQSWADNNMQIHPAVEQCIHFVAGHEVRASFPLDSVRIGSAYPGNAKEVMYPGAHSDLGGGYAPNAVGIAPNVAEEMARIPGVQMYKEARLAGVPLFSWDELPGRFQSDLVVAEKTHVDFNAYLKAANIAAGPVEQMHRQHMSLYLSYRYKYRNSINALPFYQRASSSNKSYIRITTDTFNNCMTALKNYPISPSDEKYNFSDAVAQHRRIPETDRLKALAFKQAARLETREFMQAEHLLTMVDAIDTKKLNPTIEHFFGNYVHDSMAGFIEMGGQFTNEYNLNGLGIFKFRKIFMGND